MIPHTGARSQRWGRTLSEIAEGDGSGSGDEEEYQTLRRLPRTPIHTSGTSRRVGRRHLVGGASAAGRVRAGGGASGHRRVMSMVNSPLSRSLGSGFSGR